MSKQMQVSDFMTDHVGKYETGAFIHNLMRWDYTATMDSFLNIEVLEDLLGDM